MHCRVGAVVAAMSATVVVATQIPPTTLPDGEGKTTVENLCATRCHPASTVMRAKRTPTGWEKVIDLMIERGAEVADADYDVIFDYVSKHLLATVNMNTGTAGQIAEVLEITDVQAAAIVDFRLAHGPFKLWQDVAKVPVPGIPPEGIEGLKDRMRFDPEK